MTDHTALNALLAAIFTNGRGEVGLEVGADPGLPAEQFIQVPNCMIKQWAAKVDPNDPHYMAKFPVGKGKGSASKPAVEDWDQAKGYDHYRGKAGWITSGELYIHGGELKIPKEVWATAGHVRVSEFHIEQPTAVDVEMFITVNAGHIRDNDFSEETQAWVHAVRFWSVVAGFARSSKSSEYTIVETPTEARDGATQLASFVGAYAANAWTASAARATSWRKTNHATGGDLAAGFPRRWLQKMQYISSQGDKAEVARSHRSATSAFYVATHASSPHAVLALMAPEDDDHWALIDPSFGLIHEWEVNESAKIRMVPKTQVAGVAMVTDSVVTIRMLAKEGLAPLLTNLGQAQALADAYGVVEQHGMKTAVYATWFLEGHPEGNEKVAFSQKDASYGALIGELAIVATKYYAGTTISGSASLQNAAQQMGEDTSRTIWTALGRQKSSLSAQQIVRAYARIKGASAAGAVMGLLSADDAEIQTAVGDYNDRNTAVATQFGVVTSVAVDLATVKSNAAAADRIAATLLGATSGP